MDPATCSSVSPGDRRLVASSYLPVPGGVGAPQPAGALPGAGCPSQPACPLGPLAGLRFRKRRRPLKTALPVPGDLAPLSRPHPCFFLPALSRGQEGPPAKGQFGSTRRRQRLAAAVATTVSAFPSRGDVRCREPPPLFSGRSCVSPREPRPPALAQLPHVRWLPLHGPSGRGCWCA